jgi:hypothetical protein
MFCLKLLGAHVIALVLILFCPWIEGSWVVRRFAMSDTRYPRSLQPKGWQPCHPSVSTFTLGLPKTLIQTDMTETD